MGKNKILWSLFSTMLMTNCHSVDAAPPPILRQGVVVALRVKPLLEIEGQALALVGKDAFEQAIMLLEPYIQNNTATGVMQETYIKALFKTGTYELFITEAKRIWPKMEKMPVSIQKNIAESYLHLGKNAEALFEFRRLAAEYPQDTEVKANLAYNLVYGGQTFEGLGVYNQLLRNNPEMTGTFVEDAVALLSQGNILGGRSLFENIISLYPEKVEYRQRYAQVLTMYNIEKPGRKQYQQLAKVQQDSETAGQRRHSHDKAIELARAQQFPEALSLLRWLHETEPGNQNITFDYVTVLHWSGNEQAAIALYEQLPSAGIPDYVRQNMVDAYYKTGNYAKACSTLQLQSDREHPQNKLREAELLMRLGDGLAAQGIYEELLNHNPKDVDVYLSRGFLTFSLEDYRQATWNFEQALSFMPQTPKNAQRILQIKADLAIGYIRLRQPARAIPLLVPYVNSKTASNSMQGNYIVALKDMGKYKLVTVEAKRLWLDYTTAPLFALRAIAESYIQLQEIPEAVALYQQMVVMTGDDDTDQSSLAFNLMLEGKLVQGLEVYNQLITKYPGKAPLALKDATSFLSTGKYVMGKSLFQVVINHFPSEALYRRQYADALGKNNLYQSAYNQYKELSQLPNYQVIGLTGMAKMALALDDFKTAKVALDTLGKNYSTNKAIAAVNTQYNEHQQGRVDNWFSFSNSYKLTQTAEWDTTAEQYLGGNYSLMTGLGSTRLDDFSSQTHQILHSKIVAISYNDLFQKNQLRYDDNNNGSSFGTFQLSSEQNITDELHVKVEMGRSAVDDVQALGSVNGPILSNNYAITVSKSLSNQENVAIGVNRSLYTDGNQSNGYSLNHNFALYTKGDDTLTRNLYWNRAWFKLQDLVYESPALRESVGAGWTLRHNVRKGYWQGKIVANWDRDYPDSLAFNPSARVEYYHNFSAQQNLRLGAEYGLRSSSSLLGKGGFRYSDRQYDALYTITW